MMRWLSALMIFGGVPTASLIAQDAFSDPLPQGAYQDPAVKDWAMFHVRFEPAEARPGEVVTLKITITPKDAQHWTYPSVQTNEDAAGFVNEYHFPKSGDVHFVGPLIEPENFKVKNIPEVADNVRIYPFAVTIERKGIVSWNASPGTKAIVLRDLTPKGPLESRLQVCDEKNCIRTQLPIQAMLTINPADRGLTIGTLFDYGRKIFGAKSIDPPAKTAGPTKPEDAKVAGLKLTKTGPEYLQDLDDVLNRLPKLGADGGGSANERRFLTFDRSLMLFLGTAAFWGLVTLLTPCVFPMVPITVSYFLKQGEKGAGSVLTMSLIYTGTIIVVLSTAASAFLSTFVALSVNPWMNVALGLLFFAFALSLFGMFDITLPNWLVKKTEAGRKQGGTLGTVFMALSFSITSFTCVAPFLGGFSGMAADNNLTQAELILGGIVFAMTFAAPFFVLSLFPMMMKKLPKSGSWLNTVKVVMGFLELAAALKFFRTAELRWASPPNLFTYDLVLSMWVALLFVSGLYMLHMFRMPHDEPHSVDEHISVFRMMSGMLALGLAVYLLPATFANGKGERSRPGGTIYAWVDSFLLPESTDVSGEELPFGADLNGALAAGAADTERKLVFIDFTGVTCTNCKLNERTVFKQRDIQELMKKYRLVQLYTDTIPANLYERAPSLAERNADADANRAFQEKAFGSVQLPLYAIVEQKPDRSLRRVATYDEGKINNPTAFKEFLKAPLE